jgi:predicted component of type VI protein secretion system
MEAKLIVVGGKASKAEIALKLPTVIGRSRAAGLTIAHPMVSRQHCELFETDGLLMVRDLGSLNGTFVDGQSIKESPLPPDAKFKVGPLTFRTAYHYEGDLGKLPTPVLAEPRAAVAPGDAKPESPGLQTVAHPAPDHPQTVSVAGDASEADSSFFADIVNAPPTARPANAGVSGKADAGELAAADEGLEEAEFVDFSAVAEVEEEPTPPPTKKPAAKGKPAKDAPRPKSEPKAKSPAKPAESPDDVFDSLLDELE